MNICDIKKFTIELHTIDDTSRRWYFGRTKAGDYIRRYEYKTIVFDECKTMRLDYYKARIPNIIEFFCDFEYLLNECNTTFVTSKSNETLTRQDYTICIKYTNGDVSVHTGEYSFKFEELLKYIDSFGTSWIQALFDNKVYMIYHNGKIVCEDATKQELDLLKLKCDMIMQEYNNPSDGFPFSYLALHLPEYDVHVVDYKDYELENAPDDIIY